MCAVIKNPLQRDGISQDQRLLKALLPENAKIDDRSIEEILSFAVEYSRQINFYNTDNNIDGDWSCFYENDPCMLLAILATIDTDSIEAAFKKIEAQINDWYKKQDCGEMDDCDTDPIPGLYDEIINLVYAIAIRIQMTCKKLPDGHLLKEEIVTIIKSNLRLSIIDNKQQDALIKLIGFDKGSIAPVNDYSAFLQTPDNRCVCASAWQLDQEGYDCIYPDNSFNLDSLKSLFYIFFIELLLIKQKAKIYFESCIETDDSHQPQVTLFLTFIYLFQYAIDHLNTLTRSHLLYYYEKVLCLHKLAELPDSVHVVFELAKNFHTHLVEEGTLLNGGKDDTGKQMVYALMEEVVVNNAKVEEIKTVYVDEATGVVHAAEKADTKDGISLAFNKDEQPQWKSLGSVDSPNDEIGFALASPMFFLKEGLRAGMFSYKFSNVDGQVATAQNNQFANLSNSFRFYYSSEKDWIEIENIFDVLERILLKYPLLKELYEKSTDKINGFVNNGFDAIKNLYDKLYPEDNTATAAAKAATAKGVKAKPAVATDDEISIEKIQQFIQKADARIVTQFIIDEAAPAATGTKKVVKKAAASATTTAMTDAEYAAAVYKEVLQIRNDILAIKQAFIYRPDIDRKELDFLFVANFTALPFTALVTDDKKPDIKSDWPIIKTLLKNTLDQNGAYVSPYIQVKDLTITGVDIKVAAYGMKDIVVQNDTAILDNSKEIQPFTARPYDGSYFYVGSKEAFQKKLDFVGVQMEWAGKPTDFATHYENYITKPANDQYFTTKAEVLNGSIYQDIFPNNNQNLFNTSFQGKTIIGLGQIKPVDDGGVNFDGPTIGFSAAINTDSVSQLQTGFELRSFGRDPYINDFADYNVTVNRGFMRMSLTPNDFLHSEYPAAYTAIVAKEGAKLDPTHIPKEPYTPKLKNTSLFYISTERILFGPENYNASIEQFYHITPFGYQDTNIDQVDEVFILPQFNDAAATLFTQGNLYIGLKDAEKEQKVNVLFQVLEGTGDNRFAPPDIEWSYLVNNEWFTFKPFEIQDHTRADESSRKSLLKSGIIEFSLPKAITSDTTTILNSGLNWIRAVAHEDLVTTTDSDSMLGLQRIAALPDLVAIIAQAGIAQFQNKDNSLSHLAAPLPAKTISKFIDSRAAVKKLEQPYYSFDGRLPENDNQFYTRVSERLRHKNRAICIWDYERLVLQQFPQVYKAKCLNHTGIAENLLEPGVFRLREITPGFVTVSVIPDLKNKNAVNKLEPRVPIGVLDDIKLFLKKRTNLFVASAYTDKLDYLQVLNPLYEQLKVKACVRFYDGLDVAYYKYLLNEDLKNFLSPWAYDTNSAINFGSVYHKSAILNFIEERKYVDVVLGFEVIHYKDGAVQPNYDPDWIIPTTSRSILTSYNTIDIGMEYEHEIEFIPYNADDPCPPCSIVSASNNNQIRKAPAF